MSNITDTIEQVIKAGKGLVAKLREEGSKQYQELVALGEKTEASSKESNETMVAQLREFVEATLSDLKGSSKQVQLASIGLASRVKDESQTIFKELVELGEDGKEVEKKATKKPATKRKTAAKTASAS